MRTTGDLDEDVLQVAKRLAGERQQTLGRVLSELLRQVIRPRHKASHHHGKIPVLPRRPGARPVTSRLVKELLEQQP